MPGQSLIFDSICLSIQQILYLRFWESNELAILVRCMFPHTKSLTGWLANYNVFWAALKRRNYNQILLLHFVYTSHNATNSEFRISFSLGRSAQVQEFFNDDRHQTIFWSYADWGHDSYGHHKGIMSLWLSKYVITPSAVNHTVAHNISSL